MREPEPPPEFNTCTSVEANIAILRAMERIHFRERIRAVATEVARELVEAGVDFSRVDWSQVSEPTEAELDELYDSLRG